MVGFCDLGMVNQQMEELAATAKYNRANVNFHGPTNFRPSLSFMVASYASLGLSGQKLYAPVWEVVEALEFSGLPVLSLTSVGASPNCHSYRLCSIKDKTHKT